MTLMDLILERRLNYIKEVRKRLQNVITEDLFLNFKKMMMLNEEHHYKNEKEIISDFIENVKKSEYFKKMYEKIKGKQFTWETLKEIKEVAGIVEIHHDSVVTKFLEVTSAIDRIYAPFLEPLKTFPLIYCSEDYPKGFGLEPNCVGACQIITVLYSYENNINDLRFLEIYSSKRRNTLLQKLKEINSNNNEFCESNFDSFFYVFPKEELKQMVFDQILTVEEFTHGAIKNKKTGEIYDYELEKENYNKIIERDIKEGLFYSTFSNFLILMDNLGYHKKTIEAFNKIYDNYSDSILVNSLGIQLYLNDDIKKAKEHLEKIKEIYGTMEELPAKYIVLDIVLSLEPCYFPDKKTLEDIKSKINYLKEKYVLKNALNIISERYLNNDFLVKIDEFVNNL